MKRWTVAAVMLLVGTACAGGDGGGGGGNDQVGGSVELAAVWTGAEEESIREVLNEFTEQSGTRVTFTSTGDEIATVLRTRIEGNDPPDVAVLPQPGLMQDLAGQDALMPINDVVGESVDENWAPIWRELGSVDDELYGLFFKAAHKSTVWYNVSAFEDAGAEPPETWEDLQTVAQTVQDSGVTAFSFGGADGWTLTDWFENVYIRTAGPDKYDQLTRHEIPWTDPSVVEALTTFAEVLDDKDMILRNDPTALEFVASVDAVLKTPPDAAMTFEGDFVPGAATVEAEAGEDYDFFPFPSIGGSENMIVGGGDVVVMLDDNEQSRALVEFLASAEAAEIWAARGGFASPNQAVDPNVYPNDVIRRSGSALAEAEIFRFDLSDLAPASFGGTPARGMWGILQDFAKDPSDPQGAAQRLEEAAAAAYR